MHRILLRGRLEGQSQKKELHRRKQGLEPCPLEMEGGAACQGMHSHCKLDRQGPG